MEIGKTLYVKDRKKWRSWLEKNHDKFDEIWLIYYKKGSGKRRIPYDDAVEEALCFGWIDSIIKAIDEEKYAQRFTPRRAKSKLSSLNRERIMMLIEKKKMTPAGLEPVKHLPDNQRSEKSIFSLPPDIREALKSDREAWKNFKLFPESYKRIRIGWIDMARSRPEEFEKRLRYFLKMTAKNRIYGSVLE